MRIFKFLFIASILISGDGFSQSLDTLVAMDHLRFLSSDSLEGRKTGSVGGALAREYIIDQYKQMGLVAYFPEYVQNFFFHDGKDSLQGTNVVGYVEGEYEAAIVISAHYDHVGKKDTVIYNGADDNASGVACLLELARYFSENKPNHTLIFCAFDAEELGLRGAKAFMSSSAVNPAEFVLNINMDMISRSDEGKIFVTGTDKFPYYTSLIPLGQNGKYELLAGHDGNDGKRDWSYSSDHSPFYRNNIPFLYFGVEDHEDYHQPTDTVEKINIDFYGFVIHSILHTLLNIDHSIVKDYEEE